MSTFPLDFNHYSLSELKKLCKLNKIAGYSKYKKAELIEFVYDKREEIKELFEPSSSKYSWRCHLFLYCHLCNLRFNFLPVIRISGMEGQKKEILEPKCPNFCKADNFVVYYCSEKIGVYNNNLWELKIINDYSGSTEFLFSLVARELKYLDRFLRCIILEESDSHLKIFDMNKSRTYRFEKKTITSKTQLPGEVYYDLQIFLVTIKSYSFFFNGWRAVVGDPRKKPDEPSIQILNIKRIVEDAIFIHASDSDQFTWLPKSKIYNHQEITPILINNTFKAKIDSWFWKHKLDWNKLESNKYRDRVDIEIKTDPHLSLRELMIKILIMMSDVHIKKGEEKPIFSLEFIKKIFAISPRTKEVDFCLCCRTKLKENEKKELICKHCIEFVVPELIIENSEKELVFPIGMLPENPSYDPIMIEFENLGVKFDKKFYYYSESVKDLFEPKFFCLECGLDFFKKQSLFDHKSKKHRLEKILTTSEGKEYIPKSKRFTMTSRKARCIKCQEFINKFTIRLTKRDTMKINGFQRSIERQFHIECADFPFQIIVELWNLQTSVEQKLFTKIKEEERLNAIKSFKLKIYKKSKELGDALVELK